MKMEHKLCVQCRYYENNRCKERGIGTASWEWACALFRSKKKEKNEQQKAVNFYEKEALQPMARTAEGGMIMGFFAQLDAELQKDLVDFVKELEADTGPHILGDALLKKCVKSIVSGDARISGCVTNHKKKRMYIELSFYEDEPPKEET